MEKEMGHLTEENMNPVYILNDNIITSLGFTTAENVDSIKKGVIGIREINDPILYPAPVQLSKIDTDQLNLKFAAVLRQYRKNVPVESFTRLERMYLVSIHHVLEDQDVIPGNQRTLLVISTTKGNIDLLENRYKAIFSHKRLYLWELGRVIQQFFGFVHPPVIISNACISGLVAVMTATRYIRSGAFDQVVVTGGDIATEFVISGFQSFQALSQSPCKPFDANRSGLSLGEGCGTMVLSSKPSKTAETSIRVTGSATSNDANHISGPSRTGEELGSAISQAMMQAGLTPDDIGYISAHGTATPFNDEMEAKAIEISGLLHAPLNSLKGYWGHTLGAAGIIESIAATASMKENILFRSAGFETLGVPANLNVISNHQPAEINTCLKTASGFGGCNAAIIYQKE
jgi:3-oxoacyl-[acyl-carrier-protein] synthase I